MRWWVLRKHHVTKYATKTYGKNSTIFQCCHPFTAYRKMGCLYSSSLQTSGRWLLHIIHNHYIYTYIHIPITYTHYIYTLHMHITCTHIYIYTLHVHIYTYIHYIYTIRIHQVDDGLSSLFGVLPLDYIKWEKRSFDFSKEQFFSMDDWAPTVIALQNAQQVCCNATTML
jgi:hypothetical protein